ncbi:hypothetical protein FQR65_LT15108 [Abscondita terminalis]|nr:hypothetical protein FQR65_LT15108 [Abscondita terminalis]
MMNSIKKFVPALKIEESMYKRETINPRACEAESLEEDNPESSEELEIRIICGKFRKNYKGRRGALHLAHKKDTIERLKSKALTTGNMKLCQAIETVKSTLQHTLYHSSCKSMLESASVSIIVAAQPPTTWHHTRYINAIVIQEIFKFIEDNVVQKRQCYFLTFILTLYINRLKEERKGREVVSQ